MSCSVRRCHTRNVGQPKGAHVLAGRCKARKWPRLRTMCDERTHSATMDKCDYIMARSERVLTSRRFFRIIKRYLTTSYSHCLPGTTMLSSGLLSSSLTVHQELLCLVLQSGPAMLPVDGYEACDEQNCKGKDSELCRGGGNLV